MFAEIGLGTDPRDALLIPASAVLHIGRFDYVFKQIGEDGQFDVAEVQVSEARGEQVEVLKGLQAGDQIAGSDAVLLKPLAVQSLSK
jgi:multidrug efflux pump subunit AcrA (membrane-fusion protein)